jgi:hypothetical protein
VRWGYYIAGRVTAWTATFSSGKWALTATLSEPDTYRLAQQPLVFVAHHAKGAWSWPIDTLQIMGAGLTAELGPQKE